MNQSLAYSPRAYRGSAVLTASPGQLVVMLYDGARRFLFQAAVAMREQEVEKAHNKLSRAEDIILYLRSTLDMSQGEISTRLHSIYTFCLRHLRQARFTRDPAMVEQVSGLLSTLRDAWASIEQQ